MSRKGGRKPAPLERVGALTPRERIWGAMRRMQRWDLYTLSRRANADDETVQTYCASLLKAGFVARDESAQPVNAKGSFDKCHYRLVRDVGLDAPRVRRDGSLIEVDTGRERMWSAMKVLKMFTSRDLVLVASVEGAPVSDQDAKSYLKHLSRAGYLSVQRRPGRLSNYLLLPSMNTGPKPPIVQRVKRVYDPNLDRVIEPPATAVGGAQ